MLNKRIHKLLLIAGAVAALVAGFWLIDGRSASGSPENVLDLQAPPFVDVARAESLSAASVITEEAGISAWFQASTSIDLNNVKSAFRTIETENSDYILGSVPVEGYEESQDVHVYVHTDGWVLAYYLSEDPVGKIFDWRAYHEDGRTSITTKLENTIALVSTEAGVPYSSSDVSYYDFRYPNATNLMLIIEWVGDGTDSCEVNLPGSFAYYERSWSLGSDGDEGGIYSAPASLSYKLDGVKIKGVTCYDWCTSEGDLTASQLLPDEFHSIEVSVNNAYGYSGLALIYGAP
jgi:hypothetical protein